MFDKIIDDISRNISYDLFEHFYDFKKQLKLNSNNTELCRNIIHDFILEVETDSIIFYNEKSKEEILKILNGINI